MGKNAGQGRALSHTRPWFKTSTKKKKKKKKLFTKKFNQGALYTKNYKNLLKKSGLEV
jgi:hypothetical protein